MRLVRWMLSFVAAPRSAKARRAQAVAEATNAEARWQSTAVRLVSKPSRDGWDEDQITVCGHCHEPVVRCLCVPEAS